MTCRDAILAAIGDHERATDRTPFTIPEIIARMEHLADVRRRA